MKDYPAHDEFYYDEDDEMFHTREYILPKELQDKEDTVIFDESSSGEEKESQIKGLDV